MADLPYLWQPFQGAYLSRRLHWQAGQQLAAKEADDAKPSYAMVGTLYVPNSGGGVFLSVPNALVRGVFASLHEPGVRLPPRGDADNSLDANIQACSREELSMIGGADRIRERGKQFSFSLGRLIEVEDPGTWSRMRKVFMLTVHSPALQAWRRSLGLSAKPHNGNYPFHIAVGVIPRSGRA